MKAFGVSLRKLTWIKYCKQQKLSERKVLQFLQIFDKPRKFFQQMFLALSIQVR